VAPGTTVRGETWRFEMSAARPWHPEESPVRGNDTAVLDADALPGSLAVRSVQLGDRVQVLGVGTRKLQDVLVDRKVPREHRAALVVLAAERAVIWVPGVVRSAVARVRDGTHRVVEARFISDDKLALPLTKSCGTLPERSGRT
jgi:tRNA(Ile)-lysidine synthase